MQQISSVFYIAIESKFTTTTLILICSSSLVLDDTSLSIQKVYDPSKETLDRIYHESHQSH